MAEWHQQFNGHELEQTLGDGEGQGGLCAAVHGVAKSRTRLGACTTITCKQCLYLFCDVAKITIFITVNSRSDDNDIEENSSRTQKDHCLPRGAGTPGS